MQNNQPVNNMNNVNNNCCYILTSKPVNERITTCYPASCLFEETDIHGNLEKRCSPLECSNRLRKCLPCCLIYKYNKEPDNEFKNVINYESTVCFPCWWENVCPCSCLEMVSPCVCDIKWKSTKDNKENIKIKKNFNCAWCCLFGNYIKDDPTETKEQRWEWFLCGICGCKCTPDRRYIPGCWFIPALIFMNNYQCCTILGCTDCDTYCNSICCCTRNTFSICNIPVYTRSDDNTPKRVTME